MSFTHKTEEYYQKFIELQEKLRKSEEERLLLEMKFTEMVKTSREEEQEYYQRMSTKYKNFLKEDRKRQDRNEKIIRALERIETRVNMLIAKTDRFNLLRKQYQNYLERITQLKLKEKEREPLKPRQFESDGKFMEKTVTFDTLNKPLPNLPTYNYADKIKSELRKKYAQEDIEEVLSKLNMGSKFEKGDSEHHGLFGDMRSEEYLLPYERNEDYYDKIQSKQPKINLETNGGKIPKKFEDSWDNTPENPDINYLLSEEFLQDTNYGVGALKKLDDEPETRREKRSLEPESKYEKIVENNMHQVNDIPPQVNSVHQELSIIENEEEPAARAFSVEPMVAEGKKNVRFQQNNDLVDKILDNDSILKEEKYIPISSSQDVLPESNHEEIEENLQKLEESNVKLQSTDEDLFTKQYVETSHVNSSQIDTTEQKNVEQLYDENRQGMNEQQNSEQIQDLQQLKEIEEPDDQNVAPTQEQNKTDPSIQFETNGQTIQYDEKGQPIQYDIQYDETGQPIGYNANGQQIQYDENGQPFQYDTSQPLQYDENGQLIQYDTNGQGLQYDANGQQVQYDENGQPLQYDANGQPLQYDESGQPLQYDLNGHQVQYDENGQPLQYDANGQPIQYDANGQPIQYDEQGQPIQYDENGQPIPYDQYSQQIQYDEYGQPIMYDENGQVIQQFDENGQPIQYYQNPEQGYYPDPEQQYEEYQQEGIIGAIEEDKDVPVENIKEAAEEPIIDDVVKETEEILDKPSIVAEEIKTETPARNVMDMLDTDTESTKQDTKVSNDSDFDFSNN